MNVLYAVPVCILGFMIQAAFIMSEKMQQYKKAVVLKGIASLVFVGIGGFALYLAPSLTAKLIVAGLACGMLGDICLNLRLVFQDGKKVFLAGIAAFLIGHLLYLAATILYINDCIKLSVAIAVGIACAAGLLIWIFKNITAQKVFKIFGIFYVGAVIVMTAVAALRCVSAFGTGALLFCIGAVLFSASDIILIFNMFSDKKKAWMRPTNLSLYYAGQLLIAMSLFV